MSEAMSRAAAAAVGGGCSSSDSSPLLLLLLLLLLLPLPSWMELVLGSPRKLSRGGAPAGRRWRSMMSQVFRGGFF
jgi:hypothetical protein